MEIDPIKEKVIAILSVKNRIIWDRKQKIGYPGKCGLEFSTSNSYAAIANLILSISSK